MGQCFLYWQCILGKSVCKFLTPLSVCFFLAHSFPTLAFHTITIYMAQGLPYDSHRSSLARVRAKSKGSPNGTPCKITEERSFTLASGPEEIVQERLDLFTNINWNALFPVKWRPSDMQLTFWKKPIGDRDTFKLVLFLLGNNGCSPYLLKRGIMLWQFWSGHSIAKKEPSKQISFSTTQTPKPTLGFITVLITSRRR